MVDASSGLSSTVAAKELFGRLSDETARIERIVFLAGMMGDGLGDQAEPLTDLLDDFDDLRQCFPDLPERIYDALERRGGADSFSEWAYEHGKFGYAIQFATPVFDGTSYSWGHYNTHWFYGESFDDAVEKGFTWVAECRARETTKGKKRTSRKSVPVSASGTAE